MSAFGLSLKFRCGLVALTDDGVGVWGEEEEEVRGRQSGEIGEMGR